MALGYALAAIATGDRVAALEVLEDWRDDIPAADLGLALALAGETEQGVHVLSNAVRGGDKIESVKIEGDAAPLLASQAARVAEWNQAIDAQA